MIKANHHPFFVCFFRLYTHFMIKWHFRKIFIEGNTESSSKSVLIISNHFSWWDGFFIYYLNNKLWKKKFHVIMLEEQLAPRKFLSRAGAFSIKRQYPSVRHSINYALTILQHSNNLLLMYPQGKIYSQSDRPIQFEPGAKHIINNSDSCVKMVVVLTDYFSFRKQSLSFYIKNFDHRNKQEKNLENTFNNFMIECIKKQNIKAELN
jgi:1-acyl-sn-glycerol-3-phosphate acyltransferase